MKLTRTTHGPYPLFDLIRPVGSAPLPLDFEAAEKLDAQARAAYHDGDYRLASALFEDLAARLTTTPGAAHATTVATDRDYARHNARAAAAMAESGSASDGDPGGLPEGLDPGC